MLQGLFSTELNDLLESSCVWLMKFKDAVYPLAFQVHKILSHGVMDFHIDPDCSVCLISGTKKCLLDWKPWSQIAGSEVC